MTTTTAKFEAGKTYYVHSACDYDCIFTFTVIKRTAKTVTLKNGQGEVTRRNIADGGESECCYPLGKFSMCPCLYANKVYDEPANKINNTDELNDDETTADATNAEIELATAADTTDEINIDDATYRTILLHAEKISNGQNTFAAVLKNELRKFLNADASELIEAIKTDSNFLNRVRCYLADFPIIITNDEGTRYHLVKFTDDYCELDIINDEPATEERIEMKSDRVSDKVSREVKPCDDNDDVFALLPELDELNDVSDIAPVIQPLRQTFVFTPVGDERHQILTSGDVVTFLNGKLHHVTSTKYAAWFSVYFCHYAWHIFKDGKIDGVNGTNDEEEFFAEMAKRGACTIDEPEPPVNTDKPVDDYDSKRQQRRADNDIPQDYLDAIVAQTMPRKRREPINDAELIANGDELKAIEGRLMGRELPRFGQPRFDASLVEWYREYQFRRSNPFWYEDEYHYLDDGTRIHAKK